MSDPAVAPVLPAPSAAHHRLARNVLFNAAGYGLNLVVAFFIAPLTVHKLGNDAYGIWVVLQELINYAILLDFGVRYAVQREATRLQSRGEPGELNRMLSTAWVLSWIPAVAVILAGLGVAFWMPHWFHASAGLLGASRIALVLSAAAMALTFPGILFTSVVVGLSRYDALNLRNAIVQIVRALLLWYFLVHGYGLITVAVIYFATVALAQAVDLFFAFRLAPELRLRWSGFQRSWMRHLVHFSAYAFLISISVRLVYWTDNLVVAWILGPVAVTFYSIAGGLVMYVRDGMATLTKVYVPLAAHYEALGKEESLRRLLVDGTRISMLTVIPVCFGLWAAGIPFIRLWMGPSYAQQSGTVLLWLTVTALICPLGATYTPVFYAMNRHQWAARFSLLEAGLNLTLSIWLARRLGIAGVAIGTVIPASLNQIVAQPLYATSLLGVSRWRYYGQALLRPLAVGVLPGVCLAWMARQGWLFAWSWWLAGCTATTVLYIALAWFFGLDDHERERAQQSCRQACVRVGLRSGAAA